MGLQIWLPLCGNINNQGVLGVSTSGAPASWGNGKIGKCATFTGNIANRITTPDMQALHHTDNFSYCVWLNQNYSSEAGKAQFAFTYGRADAGSYGYGIQIRSANIIACWFGTRATEITCPANEWHHIAVTVSGTTIKYYVDGILSKTATTATLPTYLDSECKGLGLGCFHYSGDIYPYYGSMNDFRIYDHCLSAREVKEISKGLFLHYKLGGVDGYFGGKNLLSNSAWEKYYTGTSFTVNNKTYNTYADGWGGYNGGISNPTINYHAYLDVSTRHYVFDETNGSRNWKGISLWKGNTLNISQKDTSYVFSTIVKATGSGTKLFGGFYYYKTGSTDRHFHSGMFSINDISDGTEKFVSAKVPLNNGVDWSKDFGFYIYGYGFSANSKLEMWHPKLEEGTKATVWTPAPEDNPALYGTTLYDTSGYLSTATPSGTIGYSSDSPRYDGSYVFSDTSHFKLTQPLVSPSQFTCSFWVRPMSLGSYAIVTSNYNNPSSGFWIAVNCEGSGLWFYNGSYARSNKGLLTLNTWYHACLVFKDGVFTWYQNGEAAGTTDLSSKSKTLGIADTIGIGNSYTGTQWNTKFNGNISDFRMYSTALSATDVKELYNTPISLTNTGTLMTQGEFKEV